jgi:hypothetical protein
MENLDIKETTRTPRILFDSKTNVFTISGKFFPENIKDYLDPVITWLEKFKSNKAKSVEVNCNIDYLSSSSVIYLKKIFSKLSEIQDLGTKVNINWHFEEDDEDIKKTGEYYMKNLRLNFIFKIRD